MHPNPVVETDLRFSIPNSSLASNSSPLRLQIFLPAASSASSWICYNVKQMEKVVPLITSEIASGQRDHELLFGVNVVDLDFGPS